MAQDGLQEYLKKLDPSEILTIDRPVPEDGFISSFVLELEKNRLYPIVRLNSDGSSTMPVIANVFGTKKRIAAMVGATLDDFHVKWKNARQNMLPPAIVKTGLVQEVVVKGNDVDVTKLPIFQHFKSDAGRYVSSGITVGRDPDTGVSNLSYHRMMMKSKDTFGISLHSRGHLWDYFRRSREHGKDLEVAIIIGCHPLVYLGACGKMGIDQDEYELAGALLGEPLELVCCATIDAHVPASAEIVLEGKILAETFDDEGPFGEYTGYSTSRSTRNVFKVSAITHRKSPIFMDLVPGYSAEHLLLAGYGRMAEYMSILKERFPVVLDLNQPKSGTHFNTYIKIKKTAEVQPRQIMALMAGLDMYSKILVVVDDEIDIYDEEQVLWAIATRVQPHKDVSIIENMMCNVLDPSSEKGMSSKMFIDATSPLESENKRYDEDPAMRQLAREVMKEIGIK